MTQEPTAPIAREDVRRLARVAALPLGVGRAAALARTLEADLRLLRVLRGVDAGEAHPLGDGPIPREHLDG